MRPSWRRFAPMLRSCPSVVYFTMNVDEAAGLARSIDSHGSPFRCTTASWWARRRTASASADAAYPVAVELMEPTNPFERPTREANHREPRGAMAIGYEGYVVHPGVRPSRIVPEEVLRYRWGGRTRGRAEHHRREERDLRGHATRACRRRRHRAAAGVLVDEQFGADVARPPSSSASRWRCRSRSRVRTSSTSSTATEFTSHIDSFEPTFSKVLVRYNPQGDGALNARQAMKLKQLSDWLHQTERRFLFELLVPAEPQQLAEVASDVGRLRP